MNGTGLRAQLFRRKPASALDGGGGCARRRPQTRSGSARSHPARNRRDRRCGNFRADRRRRSKVRRPRNRALVHRVGIRMCDGCPLLRGVRRDDPGRGQRVFVFVRDDGRADRLDHRMGPGARIRRRRCRGRSRMVGLPYRHPAGARDPSAGCDNPRARVGARRDHQSARAADRDAHHVRAVHRHLGECANQFGHRRHQARSDRRRYHRRRILRPAGELESVCADGMVGRDEGRGRNFLRLHRLRRGLDRGGRSRRSESRPAARHPRFAVRLHAALHTGRRCVDRDGAGASDRRERAAGVCVRACAGCMRCRDLSRSARWRA